jgi:hypothetical protein
VKQHERASSRSEPTNLTNARTFGDLFDLVTARRDGRTDDIWLNAYDRRDTQLSASKTADIEIVASPTLSSTKALAAYWESKRPLGGLLRGDEIVAYEIPQLLPHLMIVEPIGDGADWIYRLVGTAIVARSGRDTTGMRVRRIFPPDVADAYIGDYRRGVESRVPWFARGYFTLPGTEHVQFESVGLPIFGRDGVTVWLLLGVFYLN